MNAKESKTRTLSVLRVKVAEQYTQVQKHISNMVDAGLFAVIIQKKPVSTGYYPNTITPKLSHIALNDPNVVIDDYLYAALNDGNILSDWISEEGYVITYSCSSCSVMISWYDVGHIEPAK